MNTKIQAAIEIFKTNFPELIGTGREFRPAVCERNANLIEIFEDGILCANVNVRSKAVRV